MVYLADNGLVNDGDRLVELRGLNEEIAIIRFVVGELGVVYTKGKYRKQESEAGWICGG